MKRASAKSRRTRSVLFEALQARELMTRDLEVVGVTEGSSYTPGLTAEQWASSILFGYESVHWPQNVGLIDPKKFGSEAEAKKFLTDQVVKSWQDILGKPVNNQLSQTYRNYFVEDATFTNVDRLVLNGQLQARSNSTNNQLASVDEADQFEVSADGYLFTTETGPNAELNHVVVFDTRDPKNLQKIASIDVKGFNAQMHLVGDQLILVTSDTLMGSPLYLQDVGTRAQLSTRVQVYNVANPSKPILQSSLTVSGGLQQSRFADGRLTLIANTNAAPLSPMFISDNPTASYPMLTETPIGRFETAEEFAARIQTLIVSSMLPDVKAEGSDVDLNQGDWTDLVAATNSDYRQQVSVLTFSLNESGLELIDGESIVGALMGNVYVDSNSVYISQTVHEVQTVDEVNIVSFRTAIYSVNYGAESVDFVASGFVPGSIRDSRMMDEYQGNLRVFSDVRTRQLNTSLGNASSDLYILKPNAGKFEIIGQLTDVADGQALYSAYFDEDQAMITTWVAEVPVDLYARDPLHGFDLSDPTNPVELSELVIPGVSTYLQRIDATHLVGVGFVDVGSSDWRQQISLYDVSDLANLKVVDTWSSPQPSAISNFGALTQDALGAHFDPESGLFTIAPASFRSFGSMELTAFKIDPSAQDPLQFQGYVGDKRAMAQRSAVVGNTLYLISNIWLQTYSIDDLSKELDRELLRSPAVADSMNLEQFTTGWINVLDNDYSTGGRVTAISKSNVGATVTILSNGTIQYESLESYGTWDELTYTVTLENGTTYEGKLYVTIFAPWALYQPHYPKINFENVIATVVIVDDKGNPVDALKQGEEYWIEVQVSDGRTNPQGVFAAYVDVQFDTSALSIAGTVEGLGIFQNGIHGKVSENTVTSLGAFSNTPTPSKEASSRVARIRVRAERDGTTQLSATQSRAIGDETLLFGLNNAIDEVSIFTPFFGTRSPVPSPTERTLVTKTLRGDLSGDGEVSPIDMLLLVDHLNLQSEQLRKGAQSAALNATNLMMDLSGDGEISPMDLMMLVNQLNANAALVANGESPSVSSAKSAIDQTTASDAALMSLLASNYVDQDDVIVRSKKSIARL